MPPKKKQAQPKQPLPKEPLPKPIPHLPPREQVVNRANAKQAENGLPEVPTAGLAATRSRRNGTDKMYFADKPPQNVPRREPTQRTVVPRLQGQNDIPSSPPNILAALRQAARGASTSTSQTSTRNSEPQVETTTCELARTEPAGTEPARTEPARTEPARTESTSVESTPSGGQPRNDPFGQSDHPAFEPQHQPITDVSPEDAHLLDIPDSESNPNFRDADNWNSFSNGNDLHDALDEFNAGEGEFNYGGGYNMNAGLNGFDYAGNGVSNWTHSQALQSEFTMPRSEFAMPHSSVLSNAHTGFSSATSWAPPTSTSGFTQTAQAQPTRQHVLPHASTSSVEQSNSLSSHPQYVVAPASAPYTNTLPANEPSYIPSYTRAAPASPNPVATTSANDNFNYDPVSTPVRNPTTALQARLRGRINNSAKKISSKTPQRKYMKANVAAHYAAKRARQQRSRHRSRQTSQDIEPTQTTEPSQSGSASTAVPATTSTPDGLTPSQMAVGLPMRKYIGFHILTREAWPMDQPPLLASALTYARTVPGNSDIGDVDFDQEFSRQLKLKESSLRGEFINLIMQTVKDFHQISPSTRTRIDALIKDDSFTYPNEVVTHRSQRGFFGNRLVFQVIGAFLFQHPHMFGTLFIQELCSEDAPKKWHAKAADKTATNGAPVGLLAFAGVAILHCLECTRDRPATGKKAYKFEHSRYGHIWTRYRKALIKYKHLGALRRECLDYIKRRYNEMNRTGLGDAEGSDVDMDSDEDMSSDYASDDPAEGPQFEEAQTEEPADDSDEDI
ncbi:hypothetical protein FRC09_005856 [Ceratobasidium sp. 395]|nr:hypothetical protein FRC09_005856 [Ceratobasidium sp. 395]